MKKWLAAVLTMGLLLLPAGARGEAAGAFVLPLGADNVLANVQGQALTERGAYWRIDVLTPEAAPEDRLFAGYTREECFLLDSAGKQLLEEAFETIYQTGDGVLYMTKGGLTGAMDVGRNPLVACKYTQLVKSDEGFLALDSDPYDERPDGVYFIEPDGTESATGVKIRYGLGAFSEGLMPVMSSLNGRMGYLNARGEWAITAQYEFAGEFIGGAAEAGLLTGSGFIDRQGNWLVTPKYAAVGRSGKDARLVLVQEDGSKVLLLDPKTFAQKCAFEGDDIYFSAYFDEALAVLYKDDCTCLIDEEGRTLIESGLDATFDAWSAMDGRVIVQQGEWGENCMSLCGRDGRTISGPWQQVRLLGQAEGRTLYACISFEVTEEVEADQAWRTLSEVEGTRKIAVVDQDGKTVIDAQPMSDMVLDPSGVLVFETAAQAGAMDLTGKVILALDKAE
ncbi:MAG: WG repeat-containing protein [Clostridia bacterium]